MSKQINFEVGTIVTDTFLDSIQELLTGSIHNFRLASSTTGPAFIEAALTGDTINDKRATANIGGQYTYIDQSKDVEVTSIPGSAGTYDLYLSTTAPSSPSTAPPDFKLTINAPAAPPGTYLRKIGTLDHTGSVASNVRMNNGVMADADQYNSFIFRSVMGTTGENLLQLNGRTTQVSTAGTTTSAVSPSPTKALRAGFDVGLTFTEKIYIDTAGRIVWENGSTLSELASDTLGTNSELSVWREGLNSSVVDDPTDDLAATITRNDGVAAFGGRIDADTFDRVQISQTGIFLMGSGSGALDTGFYRPKADSMAMLPGDKFYLDYIVSGSDGDNLAVNKEYVDSEIVTVSTDSRRFAFFIGR